MKTDQVPQDNSPTYYGQHRLLYATDEQGRYKPVLSTGWEVESEATVMAVDELRRLSLDAWQRAREGRSSPLEYYMHRQRMDLHFLAQATGIFQWRIRRHFNPRIFAKLRDGVLKKYADALGVTVSEIKTVPETPVLHVQIKSHSGVTRH